jgi:hypothetical protein
MALSRNSTKCPIGGGFRIWGFRLRSALCAFGLSSTDSPTAWEGGSARPDEEPHFRRIQRAGEALEVPHSMKVEQALAPSRSLLRWFRFLVSCHGHTNRPLENILIARLAGLRAPSRQRPLCGFGRPRRASSPETPISMGSRRTWTGHGCARSQGTAFHRNPIKPEFRQILARSRQDIRSSPGSDRGLLRR